MGVLSATLSFRFGAVRYISILAWDDEKKKEKKNERWIATALLKYTWQTSAHNATLLSGPVARGSYSDLAFRNFSFVDTTDGAGAL